VAILLILSGLVLFFYSPAVLAQPELDDEPVSVREYVGSRECADCHRSLVRLHAETPHALALVNVEADKSPLLADFSTGADIRTIQFPGEDSARPFTADDISYAVGSGKYAQRYLYAAGDNNYLVLPAEWNALEGRWQPFTLSETWPDAAYDWTTQCAYCHTTNLNVEQGTRAEDGVQCEACHGPGSDHLDAGEATDPILTSRERTAIEASIELGLDPATCGQCHSRGTEPVHGHPFPLTFQPGEELLDREVFRLVSDRSPVHWWRTGQAAQPNMQLNEWIMTAHAGAFVTVEQHPRFTAGCLTCHNVTFSRAAQIVARIEANDNREQIDILYDEADLDIGDVYRIEWDTLKALTLEQLELDAATIDDSSPFLPQILPYLIDMMHARDKLSSSQLLPHSLADVLSIGYEGADDSRNSEAFGITCAACHNPHSTEGHPASLVRESYTLCSGCHRSAEPIYGLHHPAREVFEGRTLVAGIEGMPSAHFSAENGPTCATCHMPEVPVEHATRISHALWPILPAHASGVAGIEDSCTACHGERIAGQTMQQLIDSIQRDTRARYDAGRAALDDSSPAWLHETLQVIAGDGSWGIHNYAYTSTLLSNAERELGLKEDTAPLVLPDIPVQIPLQIEEPPPEAQIVSPGGLTTPSIILLAIAGGVLLISAYLFLVRGRNQ